MENNIDYLRFSLTDKCNLNCVYCTPLEKSRFLPREQVLTYEEIARIVSLFAGLGVRKLRLTGGEPLIKKDITALVKILKEIKELDEISMTSNGVGLKGLAGDLKAAGLTRINISLDTLKREKYKSITGFDYFDDIWQGINASLSVGLNPVKLNVILMKGINDDEILDFARLALDYPLVIRFIEFFPTNKRSTKYSGHLIPNNAVKEKIAGYFGAIESDYSVIGSGPASYYRIKGAKGLIGFISNLSENFCDKCNRLRIDCAGRIYPCLFSKHTHEIRDLLRRADDQQVLEHIKEVFNIKKNYRKNTGNQHELEMSSIGG